jgi:predicted ATPase
MILVLEDLHWSETATLELLSYATRRCDPARLLVLITYRPVVALLHNQALRRLTGSRAICSGKRPSTAVAKRKCLSSAPSR